MSDYVTGLRRDLVEAAEREQHAGPAAGRRARPPARMVADRTGRRRGPRGRVVAVVVTLTTLAPPPKPADAKIVAKIRLGGQPNDAVLAGGSL